MSFISIPSTKEKKGITYYDIVVRLPLRSIECSKRYSEFVTLLESLCADLGISTSDFPYSLPPKSGMFASKQRIISERQNKLASFLVNLTRDRDLQNNTTLHDFLSLPPKFRFTPDFFKDDSHNAKLDDKLLITEGPEQISRMQWLSYLKSVRSVVESLEQNKTLTAKMANRSKVNQYIRPNMDKLTEALEVLSKQGDISSQEYKQRKSMLSSLHSKTEEVVNDQTSYMSAEKNLRISGKGFSEASSTAVETTQTFSSTNKDLLQQQQQTHSEQDRELEALRKIIARQRQIGESINKEVEEQSELLDSFSNEVDLSGEKLRSARARVKKVN